MAGKTPQRHSEDSDDGRPPSPALNRAHANRHGIRAYRTIYPSENRNCTGHRLSPNFASPNLEREQPHTPLVRPRDPVTQSIVHSSDLESSDGSDALPHLESESPDGVTRAQDPVETPIQTIYSSADAWWANRDLERYVYSQGLFGSTNDISYGQESRDDIVDHSYLRIIESTSLSPPLLAVGSSDLPAATAVNGGSRPARESVRAVRTPSPPPKSGRVRSNDVSLPNTFPPPSQAHNATLSILDSSPPSDSRPESLSARQATDIRSMPARYQATLSPSSISPLSELHPNTFLSTPNVSPLSEHRSEPVSPPPAIYTPSGRRSLVWASMVGCNSSSTLSSNQDQQVPLIQHQPEVQLESVQFRTDLTPERPAQPTGDVTHPTGDGASASSTIDASPTDPTPKVDKQWFFFPRYRFKPWRSDEKPWEMDDEGDKVGTMRRKEMAGSNLDVSLAPLAIYANSKIRARKSRADYRNWIQEGKKSTQTRVGEGLPTNKARQPISEEPYLLNTWEREASWRHEKRARYRPGYQWAVHGALNPRYGDPIPRTRLNTLDGPEGVYDGNGDLDVLSGTPQTQRESDSSNNSTNGSMVPMVPSPIAPTNSRYSSSLPTPRILLLRDVSGAHDQCKRASVPGFNKTENLFTSPSLDAYPVIPRVASTSVLSSSQHDDNVSQDDTFDQTGTQTPTKTQWLQSANSLKPFTLIGFQDKSDTPTNAGVSASRNLALLYR